MAAIKEWFGAYNILFNWFKENHGKKGLEQYWEFIAKSCYNDLIEEFKETGLQGIKDYFERVFDADEGKYNSVLKGDQLIFEVIACPDYSLMKNSDNPNFKPIPEYCKHHLVINNILAEQSGFEFEMAECDNDGYCKWIFKKR